MENISELLTNMASMEWQIGGTTKAVRKEDMREYAAMLLEQLDGVNDIFVALTNNDLKLMAKRIVVAARVKGNDACALYCDVAKQLHRDDLVTAFSSYRALGISYRKMMEHFARNVDFWMEGREITMFNTKISHLTVYGLFDEVKIYCEYTSAMFAYVNFELSQHNNVRELDPPAKYIMYRIVKKKDDFIKNSLRRLQDNPFTFQDDFDKVKSEQDVTVVNERGETNVAFLNTTALPASQRHCMMIGAKKFVSTIFRWIGEQWNMHKHLKYLKQRKEKEYLSAHVALLQMDLANKDPNSDEYRRLVQVIDAYGAQIAELDQKIAAYEKED